MKKYLTLLLVAAMLLCSCISNIGGTIRDGAEEKIAVDTQRPVGGVVYRNSRDVAEMMQAPEVVFRNRYGLIYDLFVYDCYLGCPESADTGRLLWVKKSPDGDYVVQDGPPSAVWKPVQLKEFPAAPARAHRLKPYDTREDGSKTLRTLLAAPFDYAIDPVLTVGMNATMFTAEVLSFPFQLLYHAAVGPAEADLYHSPVLESDAM